MAGEDRSLILGLKRGDVPSFELLFDKYRRAVFAYVRGILRDDGLAEDCVQDVFLELVRKADSIDIKRGVKGWLFRVARNRSIDVLRRRGREVQSDELDRRRDEEPGPDAQLIASESAESVMEAVGMLKESERDIVMMRFFGDMTFAEAEAATGVPLNTLIWRCRRALGKLSVYLKSKKR
jgi:RNA polymerase sigma-70 factor (ECF subfamily)